MPKDFAFQVVGGRVKDISRSPDAVARLWARRRCGAARIRIVGVAAALAVVLGGGMGDASMVRETALGRARVPTLANCVVAWNRAVLGSGRVLDRVVAKYDAALMFVSKDRVCGFAFPTPVAESAGGLGPYFTALDGDYQSGSDPLTGPASRVYWPSLEARATKHTNIRVDGRTGRVTADRGATITTSDSIVVDTKTPCSAVVLTPWLARWSVLRSTVSCPWVRTLLWTWTDHETTARGQHLPSDSSLRILSWRCAGSDPRPLGPGGPPVYLRVRCTTGQQTIEAAQ